jgi:hypothetical protein
VAPTLSKKEKEKDIIDKEKEVISTTTPSSTTETTNNNNNNTTPSVHTPISNDEGTTYRCFQLLSLIYLLLCDNPLSMLLKLLFVECLLFQY